MTRRTLALAALALAVPVAGAAAQSGVEDCIAQNGARYTSPSDATTHQYVGPAAQCADAGDDDTDVQITPVGGAKPGGGRTTPGGATTPKPTPPPAAPTPRAPERPTPVAPTAPEPTAKPKPDTVTKETAPAKPPAAQTAPAGRGAAARQSVATALSATESGPGLSSALSPAGAPGSVVIAVLSGLGLAGAGAGMRRLNRR